MKQGPRCTIVLGMIFLVTFLACGCSKTVLRQDIPVSTNPRGANIYVNGQLMGSTPTTLSLERNRSHILTLVKDNYRQEDVVITNRYQKEKVYIKAIQSGIQSGLFFKSGSMGVGSSMTSLSAQEDSGEAYILSPPAVTVYLTPLSGSPAPGAARPSASPLPGSVSREDDTQAPPMERRAMAKELLKIGADAASTQMPPIEKRVETSSSSKSYVTPDGTRVREKSSTSVGVGISPAGLIDVIDMLFK